MTEDEVKNETMKHIKRVGDFLTSFGLMLTERVEIHDKSKLGPIEFPSIVKCTPKLRGTMFGSEEYKKHLNEMRISLEHHYKENRHHPEHFENGIRGMNLVDLVEMICDWLAATERHDDGDIMKSLEINQERFGYSDELKEIMKNTVDSLKQTDILRQYCSINGLDFAHMKKNLDEGVINYENILSFVEKLEK